MHYDMDRRQFLKYTALFTAGATAGSCTNVTSRYCLPQNLTQPHDKLLVTNASIIDVNKGGVMEERHILIQNGKIAALLHDKNETDVTPDRQLDLGGAFVTPGLINAHCHMTLPCSVALGVGFFMALKRQIERNAEECMKHGVTTVRDMFALSDWLDELKDKIARGEVVGPRIISCCGLDVNNGYLDSMAFFKNERFLKQVNGPEQGRIAVKMSIDQGADFIKIAQQPVMLILPSKELVMMDVATIRAICEEADRHGKIVAMHHSEVLGFEKALKGGVTSFEHMTSDVLLTEKKIQAFIDTGACIVPTATVGFAMSFEIHGDHTWGKGFLKQIVEERSKLLPEMISQYLEPELIKGTLKSFRSYSNPDYYESRHLLPIVNAPWFAGRTDPYIENIRALYRAGATMGCGNDGGIPFAFPGAMGLEMYLLEEGGLATSDILKMATANNAKLLGMEEEIGTIDAGKIADIAVFKENPLKTLRNTFNPIMVFKEGRVVYKA